MRLYGRDEERATIDRLISRARDGRSGALVLRGEAGIGKSALLSHAADSAADLKVLRGTGIEFESAMPYAGLHLLLRGHLDRIDALPATQACALRAAFTMADREQSGGDRFLVGLALLTLLADLAEERPLLCLVDDAHWLDHASAEALLFAVRRLEAEPIAVLLAVRDSDAPEFAASGLPELRLGPLEDAAATDLLDVSAAELPPHVRKEILAEAMGNPLALLELPTIRPFCAPGPSTTYSKIQQVFAEKVEALPEPSRTVLLVASAEDRGQLAVILPAAIRLGADVSDLEPAERRGLVRSADGTLEFRHPLIRAAVYGGATLNRRLDVHRALAEVYHEFGDPCHRAWHLARAATGPDEDVASLLAEAAEYERDGGGNAAVAAMYEGAAALSADPASRGRRLAAAARAYADAGMPEQAVDLADRAAGLLDDRLARAELALVRANLADEQDRTKEAYRLLSDTAALVADEHPDLAGHLFFHAATAAANAGDFAVLDRTVQEAERLALPNAHLVRALSRVFAGQNPLADVDVSDGPKALRELLESINQCRGPRERARAGLWHLLLGEAESADEIAAALENEAREQGAIGLLSLALMLRSRTRLMMGHHRDALTLATEGLRIAEDTGQHRIRIYQSTVLALLAAMAGDEKRCAELTAEALARNVPPSSVHAAAALSLLDLGLGRHESALARLDGIVSGSNRAGAIASVPDIVEAAVRCGRPDRAREAATWFHEWATQINRPWAKAVALRCQALTETGEQAGASFARAVDLHRDDGYPFERARTELLYGEWLRRARRRNDARPHLHSALEAFERFGAAPWADRARTELRATGESVATENQDDALGVLTPQELQVVRLAATGLSNREIGAQLFLSPRTVGYHLYKAYPKLGVASRGELSRLELAS
ncbi:helix-turn-helix transcriptional regulator [Spirillospora sp. CA-294931]|uniref:helix-turn-helix transcriptional regulator n=1 Tax=Spirillospora sp. CA-294931 TaxID=3240042 RepID=UPI003D943A64